MALPPVTWRPYWRSGQREPAGERSAVKLAEPGRRKNERPDQLGVPGGVMIAMRRQRGRQRRIARREDRRVVQQPGEQAH